MVRFFVALVMLGLAALAVTAYVWPQSFVGRYVTLREVDVEDYRYLPSRPVPALRGSAPMARADDPNWMVATPVIVGAQSFENAAKLDAFYGKLCDAGHRESCWRLARVYYDGIYPEPVEGRLSVGRGADAHSPRLQAHGGEESGTGRGATVSGHETHGP